jgi:hypothetical protein
MVVGYKKICSVPIRFIAFCVLSQAKGMEIMMKKTVIGGIFLLSGVLTTMSIIISAAIYAPHITSWSGSKLWFAIFGAKQYGSEVIQSLFLGTPFIFGIVLAILGLIILGKEYFCQE